MVDRIGLTRIRLAHQGQARILGNDQVHGQAELTRGELPGAIYGVEQLLQGLEQDPGDGQDRIRRLGGCAKLEPTATQGPQRLLTPGACSGEGLHILSALEHRSPIWDQDLDAARSALGAGVSLVLRLLGRDPDPTRSREHVLLSVLAERRLQTQQGLELGNLLEDLLYPPLDRIGALSVNNFLSTRDRRSLAAGLNTLLASPSFAAWRQGASLDVRSWLTPQGGRTPGVIVSVAHLDDEERSLVLGVLLEEILAYTRSLPGSRKLRALVIFDEAYGFLPPHPANPPTKRPIVSLMKQGRAFGVGVVVATQNPMDLDYRVLSNAGFWCVGRLQTDADRARLVDGLSNAGGNDPLCPQELTRCIKRLSSRWFLVRDVHNNPSTFLLQPRHAMSFLRGPMTQNEIKKALGDSAVRDAA